MESNGPWHYQLVDLRTSMNGPFRTLPAPIGVQRQIDGCALNEGDVWSFAMNCGLVRLILMSLILFALACAPAVGTEGLEVGGPCTTSTDCGDQSRCLTGKHFPGGTCGQNCNSHEECPDGTRCIDKEGGVCLLGCEIPGDCRGGYTCKGEDNQSGGGEALVCIE